jgi:vacuolar protein sorting-associated protein 11
MSAQWKQFQFFERDNLIETNVSPVPTKEISQIRNLDILSCSNGKNHLYFGDAAGNIYQVSRAFAILTTWKAHHSKVNYIKYCKKRSILLSIGDDENGSPLLKHWNMEHTSAQKGPPLLKTYKIAYKNKIFPVTAFAVLDNMAQIALGLENGVTLLFRGDKARIVHEGSEMVTALGFRQDLTSITLFIVTMAQILSCVTSDKDNIVFIANAQHLIEEHEGGPGTACITPQDKYQEMAIAKPEAVYFYEPSGRGPCFLISGIIILT